MGNCQAVNPYNFVPFSKNAPFRTSPEQVYQDAASLLHGYLDISLTNTTPLIIPESKPYQEDRQTSHKYYHFFRMPDKQGTPAIPGSEIRGLIRSIYETITNSCTTVVLDHNDYAMRTSPQGSFKQTGILEHNPASGVWNLYSSAVTRIPLDETAYSMNLARTGFRYLGKYRNGQMVYVTGPFNEGRLVEDPKSTGRKGWLLFNEPVSAPRADRQNKVYNVRVVEKGSNLLKSWTKDDPQNPYKMLDEVLSDRNAQSTQNKARNKTAHDDYKAALMNVKENGGCLPVWYLPVERGNETLYYLSNAAIGRVHIMRTWEEIMGSHSPCKEAKSLCPACRLFGKTTDDGGLKGRIQVTDALLQGEINPADFVTRTLDILSTPRPSAYDFYIRKPEGNRVQYWNYDYYGVWSDRGLVYRDMTEASPRGRKFYWHGKVKEANAEKGKQNSTMESLKGGHLFTFRIYYNGITERQLSELKYAITLGENRVNSDLQFKIGHARPLGYGSVKLVIEQDVRRTVNMEGEEIKTSLTEKKESETIMKPQNLDEIALAALRAICSKKKTENQTVAYPTWERKNGPMIYEWFTENRKSGGGNWKTLPEPTDAVIAVPSATGDPITNATWNKGPTDRRPFQGGEGKGRKNNFAPRPTHGNGYSSSAPAPRPVASTTPTAPAASGDVLPNTTIDNAVIDKVLGTMFVYVSFAATNDPDAPKKLKGKIRYQQSAKSKYRIGSKVRIKVLRYHPEDKTYDVTLW